MKLLLTSAGIKNASIHNALVEMLGKPISEASALCIPTATYVMSGGAEMAWKFISGRQPNCPMCELGWKSVGVLELTALPSIDRAIWAPTVQAADVLLVNGGDTLYLAHWMRESGLAELMLSLPDEMVYVGLSAGSMVMTPEIGADFITWTPPSGDHKTLGVVDFLLFPHLDHERFPENSMAYAERWAAGIGVPGYALDDQTAIRVMDGAVEVISEGNWRLFNS